MERQADIELIQEMAEQVAIRLRRAHKVCQVSISIGFSKLEGKRSTSTDEVLNLTNNTKGTNKSCH